MSERVDKGDKGVDKPSGQRSRQRAKRKRERDLSREDLEVLRLKNEEKQLLQQIGGKKARVDADLKKELQGKRRNVERDLRIARRLVVDDVTPLQARNEELQAENDALQEQHLREQNNPTASSPCLSTADADDDSGPPDCGTQHDAGDHCHPVGIDVADSMVSAMALISC